MYLVAAKWVILITLLVASFEDLKKRKVHDKVFIYGFLPALILAGVGEGIGFAGSMIVQGLIALIVGFILKVVGTFGGADILAIAVASAMYPNILIFLVLAFLLVPMVFWVKFFSFFSREKGAPAIPGILVGFIMLFSYYG